jgi:hypothetical protein
MMGASRGTEQVAKFVLTALNIHVRNVPIGWPKSMALTAQAAIDIPTKAPAPRNPGS